jgi:hypothetical protein
MTCGSQSDLRKEAPEVLTAYANAQSLAAHALVHRC